MTNTFYLLDAVSPIVLAIPFLLLLAVIALVAFGILWFIAYLRKTKVKK